MYIFVQNEVRMSGLVKVMCFHGRKLSFVGFGNCYKEHCVDINIDGMPLNAHLLST